MQSSKKNSPPESSNPQSKDGDLVNVNLERENKSEFHLNH